MTSDTPHALTRTRQPTGTGLLLAALEDAWQQIRGQHPQLPAAQIIVGQGSGNAHGLLLGHLAPDRWQATRGGELVHELLIAGEGLADGAEDVFTTELHEGAHALAIARGISDTSRDGRYHNDRYRQLASELGLDVARDPQLGWSITTLRPATRARYADAIDAIATAITTYRLPEPPPSPGRSLRLATCACPRRIRVAARTLQAGPITCDVCHHAFAEQPRNAPRDEAPR